MYKGTYGFKSSCRAFSFKYGFLCQEQNLNFVLHGNSWNIILPSRRTVTFIKGTNFKSNLFCFFLQKLWRTHVFIYFFFGCFFKTDVLLLSLLLFFNIFIFKTM